MNTRALEKGESMILQEIVTAGIEPELIFLTTTGLKKSILDATIPVRKFLKENGIHDFEKQPQGGAHKKKINTKLFLGKGSKKLESSFYRPSTKDGDPRLWPSRLNHHANADDVVAIFIINGELSLLNLTNQSKTGITLEDSELGEILVASKGKNDERSYELYGRLKELSLQGPIRAVGEGSTAIGRSIEAALGIPMNSSKEPDYFGIEIKSKRTNSKTRDTLFAQVPNWKLSALKSSREILEKYGYDRGGVDKKLYCTISSRKANPQGLILKVNHVDQLLEELYQHKLKFTDVCVWELQTLHNRLVTKHQETFWIAAKPFEKNGLSYFELEQALHTRAPSLRQFDRLLDSGEITLDHLIKKTNGKTRDKGYLFKMKAMAKKELFLGDEKCYSFK